MYAIVDILGQQFKVEKNQSIITHRLIGDVGSIVDFNKVLLIDNNGKVSVGDPFIAGTNVTAKIISHLKGNKIIVFKKKRRKGYQKSSGHRQYLSKIQIENIGEMAILIETNINNDIIKTDTNNDVIETETKTSVE